MTSLKTLPQTNDNVRLPLDTDVTSDYLCHWSLPNGERHADLLLRPRQHEAARPKVPGGRRLGLGASRPSNIVVEVASGAKNDRPELAKLLARLQRGDVLVTFKLDRLARSLHHLLTVLKDLDARGIGFETLDGVSTRGPTGKADAPTCSAQSLSSRRS